MCLHWPRAISGFVTAPNLAWTLSSSSKCHSFYLILSICEINIFTFHSFYFVKDIISDFHLFPGGESGESMGSRS